MIKNAVYSNYGKYDKVDLSLQDNDTGKWKKTDPSLV